MANRGEKVEAVICFIFLGSKITADSDWSHEIRRWLLSDRKAMTHLDSVLKSRDTALTTKVLIVKAVVFPVVMCSCESWTIKKAECQRIDAFELWCWIPESPSGSKEIKPVDLKGVQPWIFTGRTDVEAEAPVSWSSDVNRWLIGKVPDAGQDWGQKEKRALEDEMAGLHYWCNEMNLGQLWEMVGDREAWCAAVHGVTKSRTWLGDWAPPTTKDLNLSSIWVFSD